MKIKAIIEVKNEYGVVMKVQSVDMTQQEFETLVKTVIWTANNAGVEINEDISHATPSRRQ